ncbi:MAG: (4Fe-4S)-binding protein [Chitinophagales bacterium]|nr:(4Fe-4S)-binding protein [Chitinophagales bacterium]
MEDIIKEYSKDDVTVVWQPKKCIHSANCWRGLPKAFNPKEKPWITLDNVSSEEIMEQVMKCPSGALSIKSESENKSESVKTDTEIVIIKNGPLQIKGSLSIKHKDGKEETQKEVYLCRCGQSENKPFCDGTHKKCGFKDE